MNNKFFLGCFLAIFICSCTKKNNEGENLFELIPSQQSAIDFNNRLQPTEDINMYVFKNYYNGGGVAIGDVNNDGLQDIYFTGNQVSNKLYLNQGNFTFKDVTNIAQLSCPDVWSTGASFVDINQDGLLDLYVCKSGPPEVNGVRHNELFINKGNLQFEEQSAEYGLDFTGLSVHAVFFDYDKDGDLDCYLLNNSIRSVGGYDLIKDQRNTPSENGNKLLKNTNGHFQDVSQQAGIYSSDIGFGLGVTVGDINQDGWDDLYVSNDYFEKDYCYINQKNGQFKEDLESYFSEISLSSMGADFADLNNDAYPDLFVTDMLPESLERYRTTTNFMNWKRFYLQQRQGYYNQFVRNSLQINREGQYFQEVSRFSKVSSTDWSWGALVFDFDNNGAKDIFVANGIGKDLMDQDYVNFYANRDLVKKQMKQSNQSLIMTLMNAMPSEKIANYAYVNQGGQTPQFLNQAKQLGLGQESFSNGSAYADLDNDGDLDLIVNNVDDEAFVYRNNASNSYIKFNLVDTNNNLALGAKITLFIDGQVQYQEIAPYRGFQSCVDSRPNFGIGEAKQIDSVMIHWPNGSRTIAYDVQADSTYTYRQPEKNSQELKAEKPQPVLTELLAEDRPQHIENTTEAFDDETLILRTRSREGPRVALIDVNHDGLQDFYMPGAHNLPGRFFVQQQSGEFEEYLRPEFSLMNAGEEVNAHAFDANNDGLDDLYICYGGDELQYPSLYYQDILYLQQEDGSWQRAKTKLPQFSTSVAVSYDIDSDGDLDLYIAPRLQPGNFGLPVQPEIWLNDGQAHFEKEEQWSRTVAYNGFVTDACFAPSGQKGETSLFVVGEWGAPTQYTIKDHQFVSKNIGSSGLWNRQLVVDVDEDGDLDILLGNLGLNSFLHASAAAPLKLFADDYDDNGKIEQFVTYQKDGQDYTFTLRDELVSALPGMKKKYLKFSDYAGASIKDMLGAKVQAKYQVTELRSGYLENENGQYVFHAFPTEAQLYPIFALTTLAHHPNNVIVAGNYSEVKPQMGSYNAGKGSVIKIGKDQDIVLSPTESGLILPHEVRDLQWLDSNQGEHLIVINNNSPIQLYESK